MKYVSLIGALIMLISCVYGAREIFKGRVRPNLVSYVIWTSTPLIASFAAMSKGITWSYLPTLMAGLGVLILFISAIIKKGAFFKVYSYDIACGIVSILALIIWYITKNPITAIALSIIGDIMASLPTGIKSWKFPETESPLAYFGYAIASWTGVVAIEIWNFSEASFPLYLALANTIMWLIIIRKKLPLYYMNVT